MYYYYKMVNINEFIVKPVPKKMEDVILIVKNEDLREENLINRDEIMERLQRLMKGLSVEPLNIRKDEDDEAEESIEDKYKDVEEDEEKEKEKKDKRLTKKQTSIQESIRSITFRDDNGNKKKKSSSNSKKIVHTAPLLTEIRENLKKLLREEEEDDKEDKEYTCENYESRIQQKAVAEYLSMNAYTRGLLVFHGMGSGKTCTAIVAAEGLKSEKKILVLTPESLKTNFFNEIKKCGDENFRRDQRWTHKKISDRKEAEELSKVVSMDEDTILEKGVWLGLEDDGVPFSEMSANDQEEVDKQIDKMIRAKYKSIAYNKLSEEQMKKLTENNTKNPFDNSVVIMDEVHNFVQQITKEKDPMSVRMYHYLMGAEHCKLVFLSGTPIVESPHEIAIIFNMLHGYIRQWSVPTNNKPKISGVEYKDDKAVITQRIADDVNIKEILQKLNADRDPIMTNFKILPDEESSFNSKFIENDHMTNREAFQRRILGLTSFFKGAPDELLPRFDKNRDFTIVRVPMSEYQTKESAKKEGDREIANFVAPPDDNKQPDLNKDALQTFSPKCLHMLENIEDEDGLHLVYSELSTKIIREIFLANGFEEFRLTRGAAGMFNIEDTGSEDTGAEDKDKRKKKPRFVLFSEIKDDAERETVLNIYNHNWKDLNPILQDRLERMAKTDKEIIKVFMISPRDAEGIGLKNTRFVHIVEPSENASRIEQVIGRARRVCSHIDLPEELRTVKAYLYISTIPEGDSIDEKVFREANEKDHLIREVLRAVKETAIDCGVYEKNAVCYKLDSKDSEEPESNMIIGGKRYKRDNANNVYEPGSEKPFGKLIQEENKYWRLE